jgi:hypothetical protein
MVLLAVSSGMRRGVQQQSMRCDTKSCWENLCEMSYVLNSICHGSNGTQLMLTQQISMQILRTMFPSRPTSRFGDITRPAPSWSCRMSLLPLGLCQKQTTRNTSCQYWSKTANYGVNSKDPHGNPFILTAGVYWTTWWSTTWRLFQTVMINMNGHTFTNVNFFHLALKCHCIWKPSSVTGAPRKTNKHFHTT